MIVAAILIGLAVLWASRRRNVENLPRYHPLLIKVQIICGTCSGDGEIARRTELSEDYTCVECGGASYILAANVRRQKRTYPSLVMPERYVLGSVVDLRERNKRARGL